MTMEQKTKRIKYICIIILIAAVGIGGFFLGKEGENERYKDMKRVVGE